MKNEIKAYMARGKKSSLHKILLKFKNYFLSVYYKGKNCFYFPELGAVFYHSTKCGGTSITKMLEVKYKSKRITKRRALNLNCFYFTFVRNPYSRIVSSYKFLTRNDDVKKKFGTAGGISFGEFIEIMNLNRDEDSDIHYMSMAGQNEINGSLKHLNFIGKLENIEKDFQNVCKKLGIREIKIKHENKTKHKAWEKYYTPEIKKIIYQRYKRDFELFGYKK